MAYHDWSVIGDDELKALRKLVKNLSEIIEEILTRSKDLEDARYYPVSGGYSISDACQRLTSTVTVARRYLNEAKNAQSNTPSSAGGSKETI